MAATKLNKITLITFDKSAPEDKYTKDNSDTSKVIEVSNKGRFPTNPVVLCYKRFHFTLALVVLPFGACKIYCFILSIFAFHNAMKEKKKVFQPVHQKFLQGGHRTDSSEQLS